MASTQSKVLLEQTVDAEITEEVADGIKTLLTGDCNFKARQIITNSDTPNFQLKIQHSPDRTNWEDLVTFSPITGDTSETVDLDNTTSHVYEFVRVIHAAWTAGDADVKVELFYDRRSPRS